MGRSFWKALITLRGTGPLPPVTVGSDTVIGAGCLRAGAACSACCEPFVKVPELVTVHATEPPAAFTVPVAEALTVATDPDTLKV